MRQYLKSNNIEYSSYRTPENGASGLTRKICSANDGDINIIAIGGDGTINEILNGITDFDRVYLGIIPTGSGNDFARGLGLERDPLKAVDKIVNCSHDDSTGVDIGEYTDNTTGEHRYFGISSGMGLDALVCNSVQESPLKKVMNFLHLGGLSYGVLTVMKLFTMKSTGAYIETDTESFHVKNLIFAASMNTYAEGGGVPMAPQASYDDGKLSVCMAGDISRFQTFFCFPVLLMGRQSHIKRFRLFDCRWMKITTDEPMDTHTDGENCGTSVSVTVKCIKNTLKVLM